MKNIFLLSPLFILLLLNVSCSQQENDTLTVEAYSSYTNSVLPALIPFIREETKYDSIIQSTLELIGLANSDLEIVQTHEFGAYSVINQTNQRRFFVYNPDFFDSVYSVTQTNYAIMSICFHELAHQLYRHPLKSTYNSHILEKQADWYSGYQMCIAGATLQQSLLAMENFGNEDETFSHPDKVSRYEEIKKGWVNAKVKIFKDSSYLKPDKILKIDEWLHTLKINKTMSDTVQSIALDQDHATDHSLENNSSHRPAKNTLDQSSNRETYTLYGEAIYLTDDNLVKMVSNDKTIGNVSLPANKLQPKVINLDGVKFYIEDELIFSELSDGLKLEAGNKVSN